MLENDPNIYKGSNLKMGNVFFTIMGVIGSVITIYQFTSNFDGLQLTVALLSFALLIIGLLFITICIKHRQLIKAHDSLTKEFDKLSDNRNTLINMVEEKNNNLERYSREILQLTAQKKMLLDIIGSNIDTDRETIEHSLSTNQEEVKEIE